MIKFDKNEFLKPQIYSTLDEYETRCNVTKEIIEEIEQLLQENKKLKMINEEYERLNKEKYRDFKIIDVQEYDRYELLSYKNYKENWIKLKEYLNYKSERAVGEDEYVYDEIYNEIQELEQGSDNNE